jgi:hypothetical protein
MAFRPNYSQQRGDRERAKQQKRQERLQRRAEGSEKRKAERDALLRPEGETLAPASDKEPE